MQFFAVGNRNNLLVLTFCEERVSMKHFYSTSLCRALKFDSIKFRYFILCGFLIYCSLELRNAIFSFLTENYIYFFCRSQVGNLNNLLV